MRNVIIKGKTIELTLSASLYPVRAVEKAAKSFEKIFDISIETHGDRLSVVMTLKPGTSGKEEVAYNFINHLLAEVKNGMSEV